MDTVADVVIHEKIGEVFPKVLSTVESKINKNKKRNNS